MKKIVFVLSYRNAPPQAHYILRNLDGEDWVLERYFDADCRVLRYFKISTLPGEEEKDFKGALEVCEEFVKGSDTILYVEKPTFMIDEGDLDKILN